MSKNIMIMSGPTSAAIAALLLGRDKVIDLMRPEDTKELQEGDMVARAGIEPALHREPDFKSGASTSFAIGPEERNATGVYHGLAHPRNSKHPEEDAFGLPMDELREYCEKDVDLAAMLAIEEIFAPSQIEIVPHYTQYDISSQLSQGELVRAATMMNMEQRCFSDRLVSIKDNLCLPGSLDVDFKFDSRGYFYAQIVDLNGVCNVTGATMPWGGRKWLLSMHKTDSEIVQTVFKALMTAMEHEAREQYLYKGVPVLDPHLDIEKLVELRKQDDATAHRG